MKPQMASSTAPPRSLTSERDDRGKISDGRRGGEVVLAVELPGIEDLAFSHRPTSATARR
jgi:hypothetical protein